MFTTLEQRREDSIFRWVIVAALLLEIVVFIEPAPVDGLILVCLAAGLILGKLKFPAVGALPVISLAVFALANLVSMYDPLDVERAVWYVLVTFYLIGSWFFFVGVSGRYGKPFIAVMINTYCAAGLISALLGIGGYFGLLPFADQLLLSGRARGLFKDCNVYGPFFVPVALFALTRILDARTHWREKIAPVIVLVPSAVAILLSFSRACWINFAVALVIFLGGQIAFPGLRTLLSRQDLLVRMRVGGAVLLVAAVSVVLLMETSAVSEMLSKRVTANGLQNYDRIRFATQTLALETAESRPLGIGPGQVELIFDYATHSMYIRILSENGVFALLGLLVFIGSTMARCVSVIDRAEDPWYREINLVVLACIAGHLVNSFVIDTVHWRHIWFIYALPWAPVRLREYSHRVVAALPRIPSNGRTAFATPGFQGR